MISFEIKMRITIRNTHDNLKSKKRETKFKIWNVKEHSYPRLKWKREHEIQMKTKNRNSNDKSN